MGSIGAKKELVSIVESFHYIIFSPKNLVKHEKLVIPYFAGCHSYYPGLL